ncbi:MAG TPA: PspC domain-containing protein [Allosphingosinicella sp.]|nr:PspC domain-containing protein [Allosphingosinicella sp.]
MQTNGNLFTRDDTFFGVCQGLGEDTGIPPNLLRIGLAFTMFWNPLAAVFAYVALGLTVGLSRFLVPAVRAGEVTAAAAEAAMASCAADLDPVQAEQAVRPEQAAAPAAEPARLAA